MQITEISSDGLKRELKITVEAAQLDQALNDHLEQLKKNVQIKGFRKGKVPVAHLRKIYGRNAMAEVIEKTISDSIRQTLTDRDEKPAFDPKVTMSEDEEEIKAILSGKSDLDYTMEFEVLPDFELADLSKITITKYIVDVPEEDIEKGLQKLVKDSASYHPKDGKAEEGDRLTIDFIGKIDDEPFEHGSGENAFVVIGAGSFIPGFEDGLIGAAAGEDLKIELTFPENYQAEELVGKEAVFEVDVKEVAAPQLPDLDDEFAKNMGFDDLAALREAVRKQHAKEYDMVTRNKLKRELLDALDELHDFELPPTLMEGELDSIVNEVKRSIEAKDKTLEDEGKTEEGLREEYRDTAVRRVRLGLILSEVGQKNDIKVTEADANRALGEEVRRYQGHEKMVLDYYKNNPQAMAQLRAPVYEEKVTDFMIELVQVKEENISSEKLLEMMRQDTEDDEE